MHLISQHVQRVRDLTEQAANGTYGEQSKKAIESEITARLEEINRIAANCEFNGIDLMKGGNTGAPKDGLDIQVGIEGTASKSRIHLDKSLFSSGNIAELFKVTDDKAGYTPNTENNTGEENVDASKADEVAARQLSNLAKDCAGTSNYTTGQKAKTSSYMLGTIDKVINEISSRITTLGAARNRIDSAIESISVQSENITSSLSTLRDADVATESSNYIKAQILQQASATLLATANQSPSIALNLL